MSRSSHKPANIMPTSTRILWEQQHLVDVTIEVEDHRFKVHKVVIAAMSGYFRDILQAIITGKDTIQLKGVSAGVLDHLIHFIYSNKMTLTKENVTDVLAGAEYLQIPSAIEACTQFLIDNLDIDNWCEVRALLQKYKVFKGEFEVGYFIYENVYQIIMSKSFSQLLLSDIDSLDWPGSEWDQFLFFNRWIDFDTQNLEKYRGELLLQVRYCLLSPAQLSAIVEMEIYKKSNSKWTQLVREAMGYHTLPINLKVLKYDVQSDLRGLPTLLLFSTEEENPGGCYFDYRKYAFTYNEHLKVPEGCGHWFGEIVINNYLVVCLKVNGEDNLIINPVQQWYIFNPRTGGWSEMANLPRDYDQGSLAQNSDSIYAVGGVSSLQDTSTSSSNIDKYDFRTETWKTIAQLRFAGMDHSAYVLNGKLYVCGGVKNDGPPQDTMDCLTLSTMKWDTKASMLKPRCNHVLHDLEIKGGHMLCILDDMYRLECYNLLTNQWSKCAVTYTEKLPHRIEVTESSISTYNSIYLVTDTLEEIIDGSGQPFCYLDFSFCGHKESALHAEVRNYYEEQLVGEATKFHPSFISMSPLEDLLDSS